MLSNCAASVMVPVSCELWQSVRRVTNPAQKYEFLLCKMISLFISKWN